MNDPMFIAMCIVAVGTLYFVPAMIAAQKKKKQFVALIACNLLFGWTGIGWAVCLIWSLMED